MPQRFHPRLLAAAAFAAILVTAAPGHAEPRENGCTADYHERLTAIAGAELVTYREAPTAIGPVDPALPGRLLFAVPNRPDLSADARRAVETGTRLARQQGRTSFARDANTRWIAERIREDLTDYLRQKPTAYLCAGLEPYPATLRTQAAQGAPAPERLAEDVEAQRATLSASLDAAFGAMRPPPPPRFAPADRPGAPSIDGLRLALDASFPEPDTAAAPTRFADRGVRSQISESRTDPDLPPLNKHAARQLATDADLQRAVTALLGTAARGGFMAEAGLPAPAEPAARPVLARLRSVSQHLGRPDGRIADPIVRAGVERALFDLEVLDYLRTAASAEAADPLTAAMFATMGAIEAAHAQSCTCAD